MIQTNHLMTHKDVQDKVAGNHMGHVNATHRDIRRIKHHQTPGETDGRIIHLVVDTTTQIQGKRDTGMPIQKYICQKSFHSYCDMGQRRKVSNLCQV